MVKLIVNLVRKPTLSRAEFSVYWREHHAPLVISVNEFSRHVRKYVQNHILPDSTPAGAEGTFDGVAELWFDGKEAMATAFEEPLYLKIIRPDELKFLNLDQCVAMVTEEISMA